MDKQRYAQIRERALARKVADESSKISESVLNENEMVTFDSADAIISAAENISVENAPIRN